MKRSPIEVFNTWAEIGKDEGMAAGHRSAVLQMLDLVLQGRSEFSFIDAGCGNGWVVRLVRSFEGCVWASGIDGSANMIEKAKNIDTHNSYVKADLTKWFPKEPADIVHSMEVMYYLEDPALMIKRIHDSWLKQGGAFVMGIDFYSENTVSHDWPEKCGINLMRLYSEAQWIAFFTAAGFITIHTQRLDQNDGWAGTLCILGQKAG